MKHLSTLQAAEELQAKAEDLKEQLAQSLSDLAKVQEQHSSLKQPLEEAAAREEDLMRRCKELQAQLEDAKTQNEASAAELSQSQSVAAAVCAHSAQHASCKSNRESPAM